MEWFSNPNARRGGTLDLKSNPRYQSSFVADKDSPGSADLSGSQIGAQQILISKSGYSSVAEDLNQNSIKTVSQSSKNSYRYQQSQKYTISQLQMVRTQMINKIQNKQNMQIPDLLNNLYADQKVEGDSCDASGSLMISDKDERRRRRDRRLSCKCNGRYKKPQKMKLLKGSSALGSFSLINKLSIVLVGIDIATGVIGMLVDIFSPPVMGPTAIEIFAQVGDGLPIHLSRRLSAKISIYKSCHCLPTGSVQLYGRRP